MTNEEIENWLKRKGRDRAWLALQIPASKGTVDNWFSKGFSAPALTVIQLLMDKDEDASANDTGLIQFTVDEFERIERARQRSGYESRPPFYRDAILKQITAMEAEMPTIKLPTAYGKPTKPTAPASDLRVADENASEN